ncbi:hypothetical protein KDU71_07930 [Carboxylicivirga sediminis]|uniref:YncE family protein n=1 Tax=Carboxylicivirga sediminis TaxID=2006564 RepID=A0A941IXJ8_9BACT|nr:hypothetical protein [Carboxylicivirga sediminis]MBR8535484.1 hypothetical protein [Carboxylicivirga sediminis]
MKKLFIALGFASTIGFTACNDVSIYNLEEHQGAFILNQGTSNGSISYYNYEREECKNDIYNAIGAGATAMAINKTSDFTKGIAYVAVPSENSIEMINLEGFIGAGSIEDFTSPVDVMTTGGSTIYVAHGESSVSAYDLESNTIVKTYEVAQGPQKLISSGKYLYAACKGSGDGAKVHVIDMSNQTKVDTVDLVFNNPIDMVVDIDRKVWVYCNGDTQGLIKLDRQFVTEEIGEEDDKRDTTYLTNEPIDFELGPKLADSPHPLTISNDGRTLYYVYGKLCENSVYIDKDEEEELSTAAIVTGDYANEPFRGIDYDSRRRRLMALTTNGELVVHGKSEDMWSAKEVYKVGAKPIMTRFNF